MYCLLLFIAGTLAASHPELRGEEPDQADIGGLLVMAIPYVMKKPQILVKGHVSHLQTGSNSTKRGAFRMEYGLPPFDNGQCVPIKCNIGGVPPVECTRQCALRQYVPICHPPGDFCLCQHLVGNSVELVSPDEVIEQPAEEESSFSIFAVIVPLRDYFSQEVKLSSPSDEPLVVNVHEGRLYWDFRYILSGLLLLMLALVIYELVMCRVQYCGKPEEDEDPKKKVLNV